MSPPRRTPGVRIRKARLTDHPALCALWRQVDTFHAGIRPDFFSPSPDPARSKLYLDRILEDPDQELLVATSGERVVGLCHLQLYDTPRSPVFADRRRAHIEDLVIDESERRQGVGRSLLEAAEAWARRHRAEQMVLTVWHGNDAADRFYRSADYRPVSCVLARELD